MMPVPRSLARSLVRCFSTKVMVVWTMSWWADVCLQEHDLRSGMLRCVCPARKKWKR